MAMEQKEKVANMTVATAWQEYGELPSFHQLFLNNLSLHPKTNTPQTSQNQLVAAK